MRTPRPDPDAPALVAAWRAAAASPAVAAAVESLFADVAAAIHARAPACWASGRCCHFEAHGHRLYVTGLEAAFTLARLPPAPPPPPSPSPTPSPDGPALRIALPRAPQLSGPSPRSAAPAPDCPFQSANLCTIHAIKPLACRVYFCDQSAQAWQHDLMERLMASLRALHDAHHIPYRYLEWRSALAMLGHPALTPPADADTAPPA